MLLRDITAESIQAVLPRVREGLGGNQRTSPVNLKCRLSKGFPRGGRLLPLPTAKELANLPPVPDETDEEPVEESTAAVESPVGASSTEEAGTGSTTN